MAMALVGWLVLASPSGGLAAAGTLETADRLLMAPDLNKQKVLQAFSTYESLLPVGGAERLPILIRLARTAFLIGEFGEKGQRRLYYEQGREYAEAIMQEYPDSVAGPYWLGMHLAGLADVNRLRGVRLLPQIITALERALAMDQTYDQAGAYRVLGRIYYEAPRPPISVGNIKKSFEYLSRAAQIAPANSTNHLYLAETMIKLGQKEEAGQELNRVLTVNQNADGPYGLMADQRQARELLKKHGFKGEAQSVD
ncbi:hypothetical protein Desac_0264 [Desulfobacca acetoxidans DSM 11109]|uniref:Uncharacterized protein n=2 Tax=Desulfobacca acetoxidans TaxID=60893 RepID=F2NEG6_DESAR|nr:hypothetical protein Desac_0264 [Desulfobacca acetoxidans DSM 11109]